MTPGLARVFLKAGHHGHEESRSDPVLKSLSNTVVGFFIVEGKSGARRRNYLLAGILGLIV